MPQLELPDASGPSADKRLAIRIAEDECAMTSDARDEARGEYYEPAFDAYTEKRNKLEAAHGLPDNYFPNFVP